MQCSTVSEQHCHTISSVAQSCPTLCDPMNHSMPGLPIRHQLLESTQTYVHRVGDAIQPSHPLSSPSPPAFNLSQHQGLFQWVSFSHQVANVLELQLHHQSFQRNPRADLHQNGLVGSLFFLILDVYIWDYKSIKSDCIYQKRIQQILKYCYFHYHRVKTFPLRVFP